MKITDRKHLDQYRNEFLAHIETQKKKYMYAAEQAALPAVPWKSMKKLKNSLQKQVSTLMFPLIQMHAAAA